LGSHRDCTVYHHINRSALAPGNIGIPTPGIELKLLPHQGKLRRACADGTLCTATGIRPRPTRLCSMRTGFFRTGDAVIFSDLDDSAQGLIFNGRTTEYFKLLTGTWVDAAAVRLLAHAASAGLITDVGDWRPPGRGRTADAVRGGSSTPTCGLPDKALCRARRSQGSVRRVTRNRHATVADIRFRRDHRGGLAECAPDPRAPHRWPRRSISTPTPMASRLP
jgi:hypothetical protein